MNLSNNTILITGGTAGIGLELGKELKVRGNKVILMGRNRNALEALGKQGFETIQCDLEQQEEIENAVIAIQNKYPELNVLCNNAGIQHNYLFADAVVSPDKIRTEIAVNVTGQMLLTHLLIPTLVTNTGARIINTTSGLGYFPKSDGIVYSASKAAMVNFTTGLRYALRKTGVMVHEFIPPVTATGMTAGREGNQMTPETLISKIIPQLRKDKKVLTVGQVKLFRFIAHYFPGVANKIVSK